MRAGKMKHRVTIQENVSRQSPTTGAVIKEWRDVATVWAEVTSISGRELIAAQAELSEVTVRVWIRYRKGLTTKHRLAYTEPGMAQAVYNITAVLPDSDRTRVELLCSGGLNNG